MHPPRRNIVQFLMLWLCAVALFAPAQGWSLRIGDSPWRTINEAWFVIEIDGQRAGWASEIVADDGERFRTEWQQHLSIRRGEQTTTLELRSTAVETHRGDPLSIEMHTLLASTPDRRAWVFHSDGRIEERIERGGAVDSRTVARPEGTWFMPHAAGRFEAARRESGAGEIAYRLIDATAGLRAVNVHMQRIGDDHYTLAGRSIPVSVWDVTTSVDAESPQQRRRAMVSEDGEVVYIHETAGALTLTQRRVSREEAMRPLGRVPELLISAFIRPDQRIVASHRTTSAQYRLRYLGDEPISFPSSSVQSVERIVVVEEDDNDNDVDEGEGGWLISIDLSDPQPAPEADLDQPRYRQATPLCDSEDQMIVNMAREAVQRVGDDPARQAEALRMATFRHIRNKDLGTAFASASEAVRSRSGDCTEHAVLLCALLRAEGIPARIATGLVYVESFGGQRHVFGWHMWTQALIDGRWVDLDSTLRHPFSAAHILTGTSSLADGAMGDEFGRLAVLMGQIEIEVIEVGYEQVGQRRNIETIRARD